MKGIILAGGAGTRLYPTTNIVSKQLLPIYNKPMIYYPLSTLMLSGIKEILIISTPQDINKFKDLLGDGENFGISLSYDIQEKPNGIAEAISIGEQFIADDDVCLILGDNVFYGSIHLNDNKEVVSIEEKPFKPKSNYAAVGLYFYKNYIVDLVKDLKPSKRGELEITDLNIKVLKNNRLKTEILDSVFWLDTGTHDALVEASNFIKTVENREGKKVSCLEEIAYKYNYINDEQLKKIILKYNNEYGNYLKKIVK